MDRFKYNNPCKPENDDYKNIKINTLKAKNNFNLILIVNIEY